MELVLEVAKNGLDTCKALTHTGWRYIYSKYAPEKVNVHDLHQDVEMLIILGAGLGYELNYYQQNSVVPIFVVESEAIFKSYIEERYDVNFISIETLMKLDFTKSFQLIEHTHLTELNPQFYKAFKDVMAIRTKKKQRICLMAHNTLQQDCTLAFEKLGFETKIIDWSPRITLKKELLKINPAYVFSINYSLHIAAICEELQIPYLSWTVDTPSYSLFSQEALNYEFSHKFVYDEEIVRYLQQQQVKKVYYLPVAANVTRFEKIILSAGDRLKYTADVSFLGNSCGHNEYMNSFQSVLSDTTKGQIEHLVAQQLFNSEPIIQKGIDEQLIRAFEQESNYCLFKETEPLLSKEKRLNYLLGRYHSYQERTMLIRELGKLYPLNVYGDHYWLNDPIIVKANSYKGLAENFIEMPKIFKASKININNIRYFVESGLPQRVFDVLACEGFLVTNAKRDIEKYFVNQRDLVIYRDLQDLQEIISYYLEHEDEREIIARQGFETVQEHTFEKRIEEMLTIIT